MITSDSCGRCSSALSSSFSFPLLRSLNVDEPEEKLIRCRSSSELTRFASRVKGAVIALVSRLTTASAITPLRSNPGLLTSPVTGTCISITPLESVRMANASSSGRSTALSLDIFSPSFSFSTRIALSPCRWLSLSE